MEKNTDHSSKSKHSKKMVMASIAISIFLLLVSFRPFQAVEEAPMGSAIPGGQVVAGVEEGGGARQSPGAQPGQTPPDEPGQSPAPGAPKAYGEGQVTLDGVLYWCYPSGEAAIRNASSATGNFVVPKEIAGPGGETYRLTRIEGYTADGRYRGAFQNSKITGLAFEAGNSLQYIGDQAFSNCYGLVGASVQIPATVTYIGADAFNMYDAAPGLGELRHPHVAQVSGTLPPLEEDTPLPVPEEALAYESTVDSTRDNTTLHKAASWTDEALTEAEIRIDYGRQPQYSGKVDFVFVMDYSNSMLATTQATGADGTEYTWPRSLLTSDVVYGVSNILLDSGLEGYDNRVGMVAFGSNYASGWTSDFTGSPADVEDTLFKHPLTLTNGTNYSSGLQSAIDLINNRADKSRQAVVIFLSDGEPNNGYGTAEAKTLRGMGVKVYPIAIYTQPNSYLTAISHDGNTAYNAQSTDAFESIIMEVVEEIIEQVEPLAISLLDVLADPFSPATGTPADITVSPGGGSATLAGDTLTWDLAGTAPGAVHHVLIKARLKPGAGLSASGTLTTNASLGAADGSLTTSAQPGLERYLKHHAFENGSEPGQPLPGEILALLPPSGGGYRNQTAVTPGAVDGEVQLPGGDKWIFGGWDRDTATIEGADVTFTGVWRRAGLDFAFTKTDGAGTGLANAAFDLYFWRGGAPPGAQDEYVSGENTAADRWVKANDTPIVSAGDGNVQILFPSPGVYQLVETGAPAGYHLPQVQWRFTIGAGDALESIETILRDATVTHPVDFQKTTVDGADAWRLPNYPEAEFSFLKVSGGEQTTAAALDGAEFRLYAWAGSSPPEATLLVNDENVAQGLWRLAGTTASQNGGRVSFILPAKAGQVYQLVETRPPENFQLPGGQWRIAFTAAGDIDAAAIARVPSLDGGLPPPLEIMPGGPFAGELALVNIPQYELPAMGGVGIWPFVWGGAALLLAGALTGILVRAHTRRQRMRRIALRQAYRAHTRREQRPRFHTRGNNNYPSHQWRYP